MCPHIMVVAGEGLSLMLLNTMNMWHIIILPNITKHQPLTIPIK